jgi:hypothetical protein
MKSTMASAALLLVLALALVSAPLTAEAKRKKAAGGQSAPAAADSFCGTYCEGKRGAEFALCKDECELQQRANLVGYGRVDCRGKCTETKGITKEGLVICLDKCEKDYKVKAAVVTADCAKTCAREKTKMGQENCKIQCTPPPA